MSEKNNEAAAGVVVENGAAAEQVKKEPQTTQAAQPAGTEAQPKATEAAPQAPAAPQADAPVVPNDTAWYEDGKVWCWIGGVAVAVLVGAAAGIWWASRNNDANDVNIDAV